MKYAIILAILLTVSFSPVFAENMLQNTQLHAESAVISLDIDFGEDTVKYGLTRTWITNHLDEITLTFYGDEITLTETELKTTSSGNHFRILSLPEGILIYGHKNIELDNYKINIYIATDNGLSKFSISSAFILPDDKVIEQEPEEEKAVYVPELIITSSHDFITYWKDTFNIDVQSYDAKINPSATGFEGRIDGVDLTVILSLGENVLTTIKGVTEYGEWVGNHFIQENIIEPGEYTVDILATLNNQTISKSSSMFIIAKVISSDSSNHVPIAFAGNDQSVATSVPVTLDGSGSSDPDGDTITFSWVQTSGTTVTLSDSTAVSPTFTSNDTAEFELTVSDGSKSDTDTVTITVT